MKKSFVTTIQCRMKSTRFYGKAVKPFGKKLALQLLLDRIKQSNHIKKIILATTTDKKDNILVEIAKKNNIYYYRGSEGDVLGRLSEALANTNEENVIQLTGDNPFIDPNVIDYLCKHFLKNKIDFLTNNGFMNMKNHRIPLGMDVSIFQRKKIIQISKLTKDKEDREHPTLYFYRAGKKKYKIKSITIPKKWTRSYNPRLTLDTPNDYKFLKKIYNALSKGKNTHFKLTDILVYLDKNKKLLSINNSIKHRIPSGL